MIPNGMNPHGLENRTLTFSVLENGNPVFTCLSDNRLYCWATFSDQIKNYVGSMYGKLPGDLELSDVTKETEAEWDELVKYKSKEFSGNHYMVHGNATLYYQIWTEMHIPEYATVFVLDTSGSINTADYTEVKNAITGEIYAYTQYDKSQKDSLMFVYSGTHLKNIKLEDSVLGTIPFSDATPAKIWEVVDPFITNVPKNSSSEAMVTNMYYSIEDIRRRMFEGGAGSAKIGRHCRLVAVTFVMLTDESVFSGDTLEDVGELKKTSSTWYNEWFATWQSTATNKFPTPTTVPSAKDGRIAFCQEINMALKQMSYYYGVNFTWGLYGGLAQDANIVKKESAALWYNKSTYSSGTITYDENQELIVPSDFHVEYPYYPMCRIELFVDSAYILPGNNALKADVTMTPSDQYDQPTLLAHWHKEEEDNNQYCAFRFLRYDDINHTRLDKPVRLPSKSQMNLVDGYTYKWTTYMHDERFPTKEFDCNDTVHEYNVDVRDTLPRESGVWVVRFRLVGEIIPPEPEPEPEPGPIPPT